MSEATQPKTEQAQTPAPALYDMSAAQRVPMQTERSGKLYNVVHIIDPLKREALLEYERALQIRLMDAETSESDEQDATAITSNPHTAAVAFYDEVAVGTEGYRFKNAENWKMELAESDKVYVVNNILLAAELQESPLAAVDEGCPAEDDEQSTHNGRCVFNGLLVPVSHTLRAGTAEELSQFTTIMGRALLVTGTQFGQKDQRIPSRALALEILYDKVKVAATGYKDGRVPLHHKKLFVTRHFKKQQKLVAKNASGSPTQ